MIYYIIEYYKNNYDSRISNKILLKMFHNRFFFNKSVYSNILQ